MTVPDVEDEREEVEIEQESVQEPKKQAEMPEKPTVSPIERVDPVDEVELPPGLDTFALSVKVATSWLNIKQALRTVAKSEAWGPEWQDVAYLMAWPGSANWRTRPTSARI